MLGDRRCRERAVDALGFLWERMRAPDGTMFHCFSEGEARVPGLLQDCVWTGRAMLGGYRVLGDPLYLGRARELADVIVGTFRNSAGGFYDVAQPGPGALGVRVVELAQNARAAQFFGELADLGGDRGYRRWQEWALRGHAPSLDGYGAFAAGFGLALAHRLEEGTVTRVSGVPGHPALRVSVRAALCGRARAVLTLELHSAA